MIIFNKKLSFRRFNSLFLPLFKKSSDHLALISDIQINNLKTIDFTSKHSTRLREGVNNVFRKSVSPSFNNYPVVREIISDFKRTKGLRVFGFGVGYGNLLFFLKNYLKSKVAGVELFNHSKAFVNRKKLNIAFGKSVADSSLKNKGKFDVTYSINVFQSDVLSEREAIKMLENAASLTRKGGKSYHVLMHKDLLPITHFEKILQRVGFKLDFIKEERTFAFIKLTKI